MPILRALFITLSILLVSCKNGTIEQFALKYMYLLHTDTTLAMKLVENPNSELSRSKIKHNFDFLKLSRSEANQIFKFNVINTSKTDDSSFSVKVEIERPIFSDVFNQLDLINPNSSLEERTAKLKTAFLNKNNKKEKVITILNIKNTDEGFKIIF